MAASASSNRANSAGFRYAAFGGLAVIGGRGGNSISAAKQRVLLAVLLTRANQPVSVDG